MSLSKAAFFVRNSASRNFLSKFVTEVNGGNGHGTKFSSAGWFAGNGIRHFLGTSRQTSTKAFNTYTNYYQNVRGFRSGKKSPGESTKTTKSDRTNHVNAELNESGSRIADKASLLVKPICFTAFVAGASFVGTTIYSYEKGNFALSKRKKKDPVRPFERGVPTKLGELRQMLNAWWSKLPPGKGIFWAICGTNTLVWLAWKVPALSPFMLTYFTASPMAKVVCLPMLLSAFSHVSLLHLVANMYALESFMTTTVQLMGREQFVGFYLTAGVAASLGSYLYKIVIGSKLPSVGASGAIMGVLGYFCTRIHDAELKFIFIPGHSYSAENALKYILAFDAVGMLARWQMLDHACHLFGCLFGKAFCHLESSLYIDPLRKKLLQKYHYYRNTSADKESSS